MEPRRFASDSVTFQIVRQTHYSHTEQIRGAFFYKSLNFQFNMFIKQLWFFSIISSFNQKKNSSLHCVKYQIRCSIGIFPCVSFFRHNFVRFQKHFMFCECALVKCMCRCHIAFRSVAIWFLLCKDSDMWHGFVRSLARFCTLHIIKCHFRF